MKILCLFLLATILLGSSETKTDKVILSGSFNYETLFSTTWTLGTVNSSSTNVRIFWSGNIVCLTIPSWTVSGNTADASAATNTAIPVGYRPSYSDHVSTISVWENGAQLANFGKIAITTSGFIFLYKDNTGSSTWSTSGTNGHLNTEDICYGVNAIPPIP